MVVDTIRFLVVSQPKAGTYLAASALENLGFNPTNWHIAPDHFEDYTGATKTEFLHNYKKFRRDSPLEETLKKIPHGSFAVCHLARNARAITATNNFAKVLLTRELRSSIVSMFHFEAKRHRFKDIGLAAWMVGQGGAYIRKVAEIAEWRSDMPTVKYEDMVAINQIAVLTLSKLTGCDLSAVETALVGALGRDSKTRAPSRPPWQSQWTPEIERHFLKHNGDFVNVRLGYDEHLSAARKIKIWARQLRHH